MIPIACPKCGHGGTIPPDRLNAKFHCKKCNAMFYMDGGGRVVLGDPRGKKSRERVSRQTAAAPIEFDLSGLRERIPPPVRKAALPVFGIAAVLIFVGRWFVNAREAFPTTPEACGDYVATAVLSNNTSKLKAITTPESREDALKWMEKVRAALGSFSSEADVVASPVAPTPIPGEAPPEPGTNSTTMNFVNTVSGTKPVKVPLFWIDKNGVLLLDGTKTLAAAEKL